MGFIKDWGAIIAVVLAIIYGAIDYGKLIKDFEHLKDTVSAGLSAETEKKVENLEAIVGSLSSELANHKRVCMLDHQEIDKSRRKITLITETLETVASKISLATLPVGTIIFSTLKPRFFLTDDMRNYWVPADGSTIPRESFFPKEYDKLPDLRAMYTRGHNGFNTNRGGKHDENKKQGSFLLLNGERVKPNPSYYKEPGEEEILSNVMEVYYYVKIK